MFSLFSFYPRVPLLALIFASITIGAVIQNTTLELPPGLSNHGDPDLLCMRTIWTDILLFYIFNYAAHAGTVLFAPGEKPREMFLTVLKTLLYPTFGAYRGIFAILSRAQLAKSDLQKACRAGALCMVVRSKQWTPRPLESIREVLIQSPASETPVIEAEALRSIQVPITYRVYEAPWAFDPSRNKANLVESHYRSIHGSYELSDEYQLMVVPWDAEVHGLASGQGELKTAPTTVVASSYSTIKPLVALGQLISAISTLYRARGDQIQWFGYASFGLTVLPYAIMSLVNLFGSLLTPQYPAMYLVETSTMNEARSRGFHFEGVVGKLLENLDNEIITPTDSSAELQRVLGPFVFEASHVAMTEVDHQLDSAVQAETEALVRESTPDDSKDHYTVFVPSFPAYDRVLAAPGPWSVAPSTKKGGSVPDIIFKDSQGEKTPLVSRAVALSMVVGLLPIIPIGALSGFKAGSSTVSQRGWTMSWLAFGLFFGFGHAAYQEQEGLGSGGESNPGEVMNFLNHLLAIFVYAAPPIGGFVVVGQMLKEYGSCVRIH